MTSILSDIKGVSYDPLIAQIPKMHFEQQIHNEAIGPASYQTHLSLGKDTPFGRAVRNVGHIVSLPKLGALHHVYVRM